MSAFRQSVEDMIPALRRYARALARDADVADDLVQDTLVRALRSEQLFLGGDVRSWLYTILTNLNKNRRRSLALLPQLMPLLDDNADPSGHGGGGTARRAVSGDGGRIELPRSRRHSGCADRHGDVSPRARARPCEGC